MSRPLLLMLIFMLNPLKFQSMTSTSIVHHQIEDCFYEKRPDTSLNGYNDHHDRWISEFDCLDQCLKSSPSPCRSFEHWHLHRQGLCVRANVTLTDQPSAKRTNTFVNYYEIDCRKDVKAVRPQSITCPGEQLNILVSLNGIDPNYVLLGDQNCKPVWSNESHAQFVTHIDNCSLSLMDGSIIGKLRWEGVVKDTNDAKKYERFFLCPSDIYRIRLADWTSTTIASRLITKSSTKFRNSLSPISVDPWRSRLSSTPSTDQRTMSIVHRLSIEWTARNQSHLCPQTCSVSLYSLIHVTIDDPMIDPSSSLMDSCELKVLYPYTTYVPNRPLISRGCSVDPNLIRIPSSSHLRARFAFVFYLYNLFKEPIPFQIHCHLLKNSLRRRNCSAIDVDLDYSPSSGKHSEHPETVLYQSFPITVFRQYQDKPAPPSKSNSLSSIVTVHRSQCSCLLLCHLIIVIFHNMQL